MLSDEDTVHYSMEEEKGHQERFSLLPLDPWRGLLPRKKGGGGGKEGRRCRPDRGGHPPPPVPQAAIG